MSSETGNGNGEKLRNVKRTA